MKIALIIIMAILYIAAGIVIASLVTDEEDEFIALHVVVWPVFFCAFIILAVGLSINMLFKIAVDKVRKITERKE